MNTAQSAGRARVLVSRSCELCAGVALLAVSVPLPLAAQSSEMGEPRLEEVIVTAEKRSEDLQRTAAAVSVVTSEMLAASGIADQSQLTKAVPGLVIGDQGGTGVYFVRGVGQTQGSNNAQPGIAVNMNGVYWSREMGITPLYDLERVEVLPGPQGTLWGRNSAGGAINFVTRRPTDEFEGSVSVEVGDYDLRHVTGVLNLPASDTLRLRLAADRNKRDGYLSNGANDKDAYSGRIGVAYDPSQKLSIFVHGLFAHEGGVGNQSVLFNEAGAPGLFNPDPNDPWRQTFDAGVLSQDADTKLLQAEFVYRFASGLDLTYIPAVVDFGSDRVSQFSGTMASRFRHEVEQYTQELRLSNGGSQRSQWVAGLYWHKASHALYSTLRITTVPPLGRVNFENDLDSYAAFGQYTFDATDRFRVTAGGRWSHDEFDGASIITTPPPPRSEANPQLGGGRDTNESVDWKLGAEFDLGPDNLLYANVQTGYMMGGYTTDGRMFRPQELTAYSLGSKNRFFADRLQANAELFYYDYENYQLQFTQGTTFVSVDTPARIQGAQIDLAWLVTGADRLSVSATLTETEIRDGTNLYPRNGVPVSLFGFDLPNAPTDTLTGSWEHTFDLGAHGDLVARVQSYYSSGYWMVFTQDLNTRQESYTLSDATLTYTTRDGMWSIGAFVRNIEDEPVYIGANKPAPNAASAPYLQAPRTWGVSFGVNF